jgi:hypothetical protein
MFLISGMGLTVASENKLTTTVADTNGRCLLENTWIDVSGRYIHWEISGQRVALRWHKSDLILPKVKNVKVPDDSPRLRVPIAFAINLTEGSPRLNKFSPDLGYRDAMRAKLRNPNLIGATIVYLVNERDLWERNLTNRRAVFKVDLDTEHYVPAGYSVCDLEIRYLMKSAEAIFEKSFFGGIVFNMNQTVPLNAGERSFAEEILDRRD